MFHSQTSIDLTLPVSIECLRRAAVVESNDFDAQLTELAIGFLRRIEEQCGFCCFPQSRSLLVDAPSVILNPTRALSSRRFGVVIPFRAAMTTIDQVFYHDYNLVQQETESTLLGKIVYFDEPSTYQEIPDGIEVRYTVDPFSADVFYHALSTVIPLMFACPTEWKADARIEQQIAAFYRGI